MMIIIVNLLIILVNTQEQTTTSEGNELDTFGEKYKKNGKVFTYSKNNDKITIGDTCRQIDISNLELNSKANIEEYYFLINLTCNDIVNDEEFFNQERDNGNSTVQAITQIKNISSYICTLNVSFDNSEHCCCPDRKNGFQSKILN